MKNFEKVEAPETKSGLQPEPVNATDEDRKKLNLNHEKNRKYEMDTKANLERDVSKGRLPQYAVDSAVGGKEGHRAKLLPAGKELYRISDSKSEMGASGRFLSTEKPKGSSKELQEKYQLPKTNDAGKIDQVKATKPLLVYESRVAKQPEFAKDAGYKARDGEKQVITPSSNIRGPMAEKIYIPVKEKTRDK